MRTINPSLFTRLMQLPASARADILEFVGATPVADTQLSSMIEAIASKIGKDSRPVSGDAR